MENTNQNGWEHPNNSIKYAISGLAVVMVIIVYMGLAFGMSWWPFSTEPQNQEQDETSDWQTYRNEDLGFEVKYSGGMALNTEGAPKIFHELDNFRLSSPMDGSDNGPASDIAVIFRGYESFKCSELKNSLQSLSKDFIFNSNIKGKSYLTGAEGEGVEYFCLESATSATPFLIERYYLDSSYSVDLESQDDFISSVDQAKLFNLMMGSFKFIDSEINTSSWQTYRNEEFGFEVKYPNYINPNQELNDQYNKLVTFGDIPEFEARLTIDNLPEMGIEYGYLGSEIEPGSIMLGGVSGYKAISKNGYDDAGIDGSPYVEFGARKNGFVYHLIFHGDSVISDEEQQILSSFKFIDSEDANLDVNKQAVEYQGDTSAITSEYQDYVEFSFVDNEISQARHYFLENSMVKNFSALNNASRGDKFLISGNVKGLGVAAGNHYFKLVSDIKIEKIN